MGYLWPHISYVSMYRIGVLWTKHIKKLNTYIHTYTHTYIHTYILHTYYIHIHTHIYIHTDIHTYHVHTSVTNNKKCMLE